MQWRRGLRYPVGSLIQRRDGYIFIKTETGKMIAEHRWVAQEKIKHRPLREGEVVIRLTPDRTLNKPENLVVVQHSLTKFEKLPRPNIIYIPKMRA